MIDDLSLTVGGTSIAGWTDIAVTRGIERVPGSFTISLTARDPVSKKDIGVHAGDPCVVKIGDDTVITGYIDRVIVSATPANHMLRIMGRGKCQDLVDCSAEWPGGQIVGSNALEIATKLAKPYGITAKALDGVDLGPAVPQFNLAYGETGYEIIERVTRAAALLAYEGTDGNLILARAGTVKAASGVAYGVNVQDCAVTSAVDQRYSEIVCQLLGMDTLGDLGEGGWAFDTEKDPNIKRHRLMYLVAEQNAPDPKALCEKKAKWEVARRAGRGQIVDATVDSWRDSKGVLWEPNTLLPVDVPGLDSKGPLCLSEVTYSRDGERGTIASLTLMPSSAFEPEPIILQQANVADIDPAPPPAGVQ